MLEGVTGSKAYGCNETNDGDEDIVGMAIPPKAMIFPHLDGHIDGFGTPPERFESYQQHHIEFKETDRKYDVTIYGIVKMFQLCRDNNPNMLELLYLPQRCVYQSSKIYDHIRAHRSIFLHRGCYQKFRGYAYSQLDKLQKEGKMRSEKRQETVRKYGFDTKFGYHIIRLLLECEQIFTDQTIVLDKDREMYKSIRRGEWDADKIRTWFDEKEKHMERLYLAPESEVPLPKRPDEEAIRQLLIECLEMHYGNITNAVHQPDEMGRIISDLEKIVHRYKK